MRKIFLIFLFLFSFIASYTQVQEAWVARYRYSNHSYADHPNAVTVDAAGNVYVTGVTNYSTDDQDDNEDGMLTIKYNKSGQKVWATRFPGINLKGTAIVVDGSGNVYVTGRKDWDTSPWAFPCDFVTAKYNSLGQLQWARIYDGPDEASFSVYLGLDASGNVYISGASLGEEDESISGLQGTDYTTIKYNNSGTQQWIQRYNGSAPAQFDDAPSGLVVDASGNVFVTGVSQKDGRISSTTIKYLSDGSEQWVQRYNASGSSIDAGKAIALDGAGNIYIAAQSSDQSNRADFATLKYNGDGVLQWARHYGSASNKYDIPGSIGIDGTGNVYVTGFTDNSVSSDQSYDLTTIKYNTAGDQQWVRTNTLNLNFYDFYHDDQSQDHFANMVIGADNNAYISTTIGTTDEGYNFLTLRYDGNGNIVWTKQFNSIENVGDVVRGLTLDNNGNVYVIGAVRTGPYSVSEFATVKYTQCEISIPSRIDVNTEPGQCGATVNWAATTTGDCGDIVYQNLSGSVTYTPGAFLNRGHYHMVARSLSTGAEAFFTIYVNDNELPVLQCPSSKTVNTNAGVCYATAVSVNAGTATATDNCSVSVTGTRSDGLALSANYPVGTTVITWKATDAQSNTVTCAQTITVVDNQPPTISGESASTYVLSPPNHTMRDVTINYTATDNCAVTATISVTSNEPINGVGDGDTDPDWVILDNYHVQLRAERAAGGNGRIYTITITATDPSGNTSTKTIEVKVPHDIKKPHSGQAFIVGSTVNFEGEFWDKPGNKHTAKWLIDGNTTAKAIVTEPAGNKNGKVTGSYKFTTPGVYKLQMNVTDQNGVTHYATTAGDLEAIVVIYDPNGGHTYGGGYYNSPAGALVSNPSLTGKASYGFAMNYFKNSTYPKGETQFEFKVGSFEFNALNFEYLVISNSMAQFKGTGKIIGGQSGVGFTMTVVDGQLDGTGIDKIRMKIYNKNNGSVIYDNQPGASEAALPSQAVGNNSVIVISGTNNSNITKSGTTQNAEIETKVPDVSNGLDAVAYPIPTTHNFSIAVQSNSKDKIVMQVVDMYGRVIETRNVSVNSTVRFGDRYNAGTYFVRLLQGKRQKEIKLIKL